MTRLVNLGRRVDTPKCLKFDAPAEAVPAFQKQGGSC